MKSRKVMRKFIYLVMVFWFIDFTNYFADQEKDLFLENQLYINNLEKELLITRADLGTTQVVYRDNLRMIIRSLYEKETHDTGGFVIELRSDIDVLYDAIMNATLDFTSLLENTENYFDKRKEYIKTIPSIWPMEYDSALRITSGFGWRVSPFTSEQEWHTGIDMASVYNAGIVATADGVVVESWPSYRGHWVLGGMVAIKHLGGFKTVYGHMRKVFVWKGQKVKRGQVIGIVGNTGQSRGRHLHYEIIKDDKRQNPIYFLNSNRVLVMPEIR